MTPSGIEPKSFPFAAQHLNRCVTAILFLEGTETEIGK
jgi:hypothetical protein